MANTSKHTAFNGDVRRDGIHKCQPELLSRAVANKLYEGTAVNSLTDFQNYKDDIKVFRSGLYIFNQDHSFVGDIRHFRETRRMLAHRLS